MIGADRALALTYVPAEKRRAIEALWAIDNAMGDVVRTSSQPMLGHIRLAWWRERLQELGSGSVPAEPRLRAAADELLPRGISGFDLAALESGWLRLFDEFPWDIRTAEGIWFRGRLLFSFAARILGESDEQVEAAGGLWALADAARHCSDGESRAILVEHGRAFSRGMGSGPFGAELRSLSALAVTAILDLRHGPPFEPEGTPGRAARMLIHKMTGRLPAIG
ncbi:MAG: squalene/phytoene synthase family protein [Sphingomicrobium sp.]